MIKNIGSKLQNRELFCQKYWKSLAKNKKELISRSRFNFTDASMTLLGCADNYANRNTNFMIKHNDLMQRLSGKELKDSMTIWRGIPERLDVPNYIKNLYKKCINLKKGDMFYMPEYSFWSEKRKFALERAVTFSASNSGILYEVKLPKGYNLYSNYHPILPRASKFLCLGNKKIKSVKNNFEYYLIKLELLPRDIKYQGHH